MLLTYLEYIILAAFILAIIALVWHRREIISLVWKGFFLYPESKITWGRIAKRLAFGVAEGLWFTIRSNSAARNIAYGSHLRQRLDVFYPANAAGLPVFFFVHGGGWAGGLKEQYPSMAREFVRLGYVVVLVNHRLYPQVRYPAFVEDVASALRWTIDHISQFGGDPEKVFLAGQSAGAQIVALLGLDHRFLQDQKIDPVCIKGIICTSGPYDLLSLAAYMHEGLGLPGAGKYLSSIMGGKDKLETASPIRCINPEAPPFLIVHGKMDKIVPYQQSIAMAKSLTGAGVENQLVIQENVDHFSMVLDLYGRMPESSCPAVKAIDLFCRQHA